jgi:hypothetical protein
MSIVLDGTNGITTLDGDVYAEGNILGTVSQTGGVPTGAIIESGSNANGEFVKYADGTMICYRQSLVLNFVNTGRCSQTWTFPTAFVGNAPATFVQFSVFSAAPNDTDLGTTKAESATLTSVFISQWRVTGTTNFVSGNTVTTSVTAIGRWF